VPRTVPLVNVRGVSIRATPSSFLAFVALLFVLVNAYFPGTLPNERGQTYWSVGFLTTFCLFLSVIVHELAHALVASARGVPVTAVTLMMFSGTSDIERDSQKPLDEALINIAGPAVSLVIATLALTARLAIPGQSLPLMGFLELVLILNLWLGVFNLLPALPLDGGHVVRGFIWYRTGDHRQATRVASLLGRLLAGLFFVGGVVLLLVSLNPGGGPVPDVFSYNPSIVAVIVILLAWFLNTGSRNAYRNAVLEHRFQGVPVSRIMTPDPHTVPAWMTIENVVNECFLQRGERSVAVVRDDDVLLGLVAYSDTRKVPRGEWGSHAVGEIMTSARDLIKVSPEESVDTAVKHMAEKHFNQLPVVENDRLVGMVARVNVLRFLDIKDESVA